MQVHLGDNRRFAPTLLFPLNAINHMLFHRSNWHQASDSPSYRPAHPFPSLGNNQIVMKEALSAETGANTQAGQGGPTEQLPRCMVLLGLSFGTSL